MGGPACGMAHFPFTKSAALKKLLRFSPRLINRNNAERERPWRLTEKSTFLKKRIHFPTTRECLDRSPEILISLLALRGPMSQTRQDMMEIKPIKRQQRFPLRQRKIQNKHNAAGPQHAVHLEDGRLPIRHIAKAKGDRQHIKRSIRKRQRQSIRLNQPLDPLESRLFQHGQAKIRSGDPGSRTGLLDRQGQVATASRQIQNLRRVARCHKPRQLGSPDKIHPATEQVIRQIVSTGNRSEGASHELRIFLGKLRIHFFSISGQRMVLTRGLEPPRVTPYDPESYASASSAT